MIVMLKKDVKVIYLYSLCSSWFINSTPKIDAKKYIGNLKMIALEFLSEHPTKAELATTPPL